MAAGGKSNLDTHGKAVNDATGSNENCEDQPGASSGIPGQATTL